MWSQADFARGHCDRCAHPEDYRNEGIEQRLARLEASVAQLNDIADNDCTSIHLVQLSSRLTRLEDRVFPERTLDKLEDEEIYASVSSYLGKVLDSFEGGPEVSETIGKQLLAEFNKRRDAHKGNGRG
jgi:hypothetical protein